MIKADELIGQKYGEWRTVERPGYFGRRRDQKIADFNELYGEGNWRLAWLWPAAPEATALFPPAPEVDPGAYEFADACKFFYEESYFRWLSHKPAEVEFLRTFGECIDNAPTNVSSGLDYTIQEAYSTHIQDIAVRNALMRLGKSFEGPVDKILVIRSKDSEGFRFGPGNVPFCSPDRILMPSKCPNWANEGSTESFWQSNKVLQVRE